MQIKTDSIAGFSAEFTTEFATSPKNAAAASRTEKTSATTAGTPATDTAVGSAAAVTLSAQGLALAASTSKSSALSLPDLEGIAGLERALGGVADIGPAQARQKAQLERDKNKLKSKFSMLDVDALRNLRDKLRAKQLQRAEPPVTKQKEDEAKFRQTIDDGKPLTGNPDA